MIDDSIVRGTQLRETTEFLYNNGAKEVHIRPACPPLLYGCKYLNFSRSKSEMDLITRRIIAKREGDNVSDRILQDYANPDSTNYKEMLEEIRKELNFTSLKYHRLDDLKKSIDIEPCKLCTYCWKRTGINRNKQEINEGGELPVKKQQQRCTKSNAVCSDRHIYHDWSSGASVCRT